MLEFSPDKLKFGFATTIDFLLLKFFSLFKVISSLPVVSNLSLKISPNKSVLLKLPIAANGTLFSSLSGEINKVFLFLIYFSKGLIIFEPNSCQISCASIKDCSEETNPRDIN